MTKSELLQTPIEHIDIKTLDAQPWLEAMGKMAFQSRNLYRAAEIVTHMQADHSCVRYLTLAGSLISAGLKQVVVDMLRENMVDAIVATGANIVDQDFFEALGFKHYRGSIDAVPDEQLRELMIDRIYDTYIDEEQLRVCDETIQELASNLEQRPFSSRAFILEMGRYLEQRDDLKTYRESSIVYQAYKLGVPIFVPAFSDCSAGFGLVAHQHQNPEKHLSIDSARDFRELTMTKVWGGESGLLMLGGGVPKNFIQDVIVSAEFLGYEVNMHKYAVQLSVADERDGALSGSTLREACSWGKVDTQQEQMVWAEATLSFPLLASYAYHKGAHKGRERLRLNDRFKHKQPALSS